MCAQAKGSQPLPIMLFYTLIGTTCIIMGPLFHQRMWGGVLEYILYVYTYITCACVNMSVWLCVATMRGGSVLHHQYRFD